MLELLASHSKGLSLKNIGSELRRSVGEIFRMVVVLEQRGYVEQVPETDHFTLTAKMFSVSHRYAPIQQVTTASVPVMRLLSRATRQSCHLVVYYNGRGIIVSQQDSPDDRCLSVRIGAEASLTDSCSGHVLLAFAGNDELRMMLAEQPKKLRKRYNKAQLEKTLQTVRSRGFERIDSGQVQGVIDIGFPIFDWTETVRAVLVVPFLTRTDDSDSVGIDSATRHLADAAGEISTLLGFRPQREAQSE